MLRVKRSLRVNRRGQVDEDFEDGWMGTGECKDQIWRTGGWGLGGLVDGHLEDGWMVTGEHGKDLMPISGRYTDHGRLPSANQSWPCFRRNTYIWISHHQFKLYQASHLMICHRSYKIKNEKCGSIWCQRSTAR